MGRVEGKVAFITGAARGQGRSHALRLAEEGSDIIAVDLCETVGSTHYPGATDDDLAETVALVEKLDRRIVARKADVRDYGALKAALDDGVAQLGALDIVAANAGIGSYATVEEMPEQIWQDMIDINLTGVLHTVKAAIPHLRAGGNGGSIVLTGSVASARGYQNTAHYTAAKHGVIGLMRTLVLELANDWIRVNTILPTTVNTPMVQNEADYQLFAPDEQRPTMEQYAEIAQQLNALPIPWVQANDISNALLFLASDEARYITGAILPVDAGALVK